MLMQTDSTYELTQELGTHLVYLGRTYPFMTWANIVRQMASKDMLIYLVKKYLVNKVIEI